MFFSPFSIAITSLGEERANLSAYRTFVRFALVWFLSVSSSSWCLGRAAVCNCSTPWTFRLPFFSTELICIYFGMSEPILVTLKIYHASARRGRVRGGAGIHMQLHKLHCCI